MVGNITRDPELREVKDGVHVANFGLAVNRGFGQDAGVDFFNITTWRKLAENVAAHKVKGDKVLVSGELRTDKYEKDGQTRTSTYILARDVRYFPKGEPSASTGSKSSVETTDDIPF
jgi:single-strand DNA-binding protein